MEQIQAKMQQSEAQNMRLRMDYDKKETLDYITRYIDGGMVDNNIAKMALSGSDLKKQLFGDIVDVRDINPITDSDMLKPILAELNAKGTMNDMGTKDTSDDIPWTAPDLISSNKYKILVDSQGKPKVKNIDDLLASTGYKNYIDTKTWTRQLEVLKLTKKTAGSVSGAMQVLDDHMKTWKTLNPKASEIEVAEERLRFGEGQSQKSFQAKEKNISDEAKILVEELPFSKIRSGKQLSSEDLIKLQKIEGGNNLSDTARKDLVKSVTVLNQVEKGIQQLSEQDADDIGLSYNSIKTTIGKYIDLDTASDEDVHKVMLKIAADSTIKGVLADYIKLISGAAASDTERAFLKDVMTGGDYTSKEGRLTALRNFKANAAAGTMTTMDLFYNKAPMTVYKSIQAMGKNTGEKSTIEQKFDKYKTK
jgi:hypothetical protein